MTEGRRLSVRVPVRWEDLDAYEHVNNVAMLRIIEESRITAFWKHPSAAVAPVPTAVLESGPEASIHTVVARLEIEYLRPLVYTRAPVDVQLWIGSIGRASIDVCYEIFDGASGGPETAGAATVLDPGAAGSAQVPAPRPYVRAATRIVVVDAVTGSPRRLGDAERMAWAPYVGAPPVFRHR